MRRGPLAACACAILAIAAPSWAQRVQYNPRLELGALYNDNYRLNTPDEGLIEVTGASLDAQLEWLREGPLDKWRVIPGVNVTYFPGDEDEDSVDPRLDVRYERRTQRFEADVEAVYAREDVVDSELPDSDITSGLGATGGADAGRVFVRNRRDLVRLTPQLRFELSERRSLEFEASWLDVAFDRFVVGAQEGYTDLRATVGLTTRTTPRSNLTVRAVATRFEPERSPTAANGYGLQAEWGNRLTETRELYVRAGLESNDLKQGPASSSSQTSWIAGLGTRWTYSRVELFADLTRSVYPNASGVLVDRDELRLRVGRKFTPRVEGYVAARAIRDQNDEATFVRDRRYYVGTLGVAWRLNRTYTVDARYDYTRQDVEDLGRTNARANAAQLSLIYEPRPPQP